MGWIVGGPQPAPPGRALTSASFFQVLPLYDRGDDAVTDSDLAARACAVSSSRVRRRAQSAPWTETLSAECAGQLGAHPPFGTWAGFLNQKP